MRIKHAPAMLACCFAAMAGQAHAAPSPALVSGIRPGTEVGGLVVEVTFLNPGQNTDETGPPDRIEAELAVAGRRTPVTMERVEPSGRQIIEPGHFVQALYRLSIPTGSEAGGTATLALAGGAGPGYSFSLPDRRLAAASPTEPNELALPSANSAPPPSVKPDHGNAFLGNISAYAPIYAVYGPGTDSEGKIQISFKYQLFGEAGEVGRGAPFINGLHFAYTQRMFWDLGAESSPFRNIDYMPEIFYLVPAVSKGRIALGGQIGVRHESNGRDGTASRSANTVYVQPVATMDVGSYVLSLGPRLSFYVGDLSDNPDIRRYRGATSLFAEIGRDNGLRLTTNARFNFSSGKGAIDGELSYPLNRLIDTKLNIYLFGQGFAGYGENLLDYNRRTTRLRFGIGIVR